MSHLGVLPLIIGISAVLYLLMVAIDHFFPKLGRKIFPRQKMDLSVKLCKRCKGFPCICKGKK